MHKVVAIVGMCGSGKSIATDILEQELNYQKVYFGGVTMEKLKESGMELKNPTILVGGGFLLLEKYIRNNTDDFKYIEFLDIFANAEGYHKLTLEQRNKVTSI